MIGTLWNGTATMHPGGGFRTCWTCIIEPIPSIGGRQSKGEEGCSPRDSILSRPGRIGAVLCVTLSLKTSSSENYKFRLVYSTQNYPMKQTEQLLHIVSEATAEDYKYFLSLNIQGKSAQIWYGGGNSDFRWRGPSDSNYVSWQPKILVGWNIVNGRASRHPKTCSNFPRDRQLPIWRLWNGISRNGILSLPLNWRSQNVADRLTVYLMLLGSSKTSMTHRTIDLSFGRKWTL